MFVPLHDDNPLKVIKFQYVTIALLLLNVIIYLLEVGGLDDAAIASFAIVPEELLGSVAPGSALEPLGIENRYAIPESTTLLTYMFFHGDLLHLIGNMAFLWVFADNVEDAMGHARFLVFYLACGVLAGLAHALVANGVFGAPPTMLTEIADSEEAVRVSAAPLIGASGAVAGVIAAYLMLHPRVRVWVLALKAIPLRISAALALGLWIALQVVMVLLPQTGPVAWWAHIGGFAAGAVLVIFMRRPGVPLFDRQLGRA